MENSERIVLHIPHPTPFSPLGVWGWEEGIAAQVERWTDCHTDWLFASSSRLDGRIVSVHYPFPPVFFAAGRLGKAILKNPLEFLKCGEILAEKYKI